MSILLARLLLLGVVLFVLLLKSFLLVLETPLGFFLFHSRFFFFLGFFFFHSRHTGVKPHSKTQDQVKDIFSLNAIVFKQLLVVIIEFIALEDKSHLIRWNAFTILNLFLQLHDRVSTFDIASNYFSGKRFDVNIVIARLTLLVLRSAVEIVIIRFDNRFTYERMLATAHIVSNKIIFTQLCRGVIICGAKNFDAF